MKSLEVKNNIYWVGALDPGLRIFDIIMYTPYGTTYNSYVVKGSEKVAVMETVKAQFFDEYLERLKSMNIDITKIDYIIVDHTEPDHAGSVERLLDLSPNAKVVGTTPALHFLKSIVNRPFEYITVADGNTLSLGNKTLKFITAPFLHWPDTMYTYVEEDKVLITCDSFGSHYCNSKVFNDLNENEEQYMEALRYYFDCIMGPFKPYVLKAVDKIKNLDIDMICTGHGPILRQDPWRIVNLYKEWSTAAAKSEKPKVTISYVSAYGYTAELANSIAAGIKSNGDFDITLYDVIHHDKNKILEDISTSDGILFGSPTINGDLLEPIGELLLKLNPIVHGGKVASAFGSYGWSGEAVPNIEARLKQLKMKQQPGLKISFKPSKDDLKKAFDFGSEFGKRVLVNLGKLPADAVPQAIEKKKQSDSKLADKMNSVNTGKVRKWKCLVCNEVFEGEFPPDPCPVCGAGADQFIDVTDELNEKASHDTAKAEVYAIIGNGAAGYYAAATIRKNNSKAVIKIISAENELTYYRPQLSDYLSEEIKESSFYISNKEWYDKNGIELILGKKISNVRVNNKELVSEDGYTLKYDKLIFANGSYNFIPHIKGSDLSGVYTLKYKSDANRIKLAMKDAKSAVIIGGGLLGLEAAWELKKSGIAVTVVEFANRLLPRQLDDKSAELFKALINNSGVELILNDSAAELIADDSINKVDAVKLSSGKIISADLVLFSTGIRPNKDLAEKSGIACNKGIIVNEKMETNIKDVFACGDVAELNGLVYGNWTAAIEMGKVAGANSVDASTNSKFKHFVSSVIFKALNTEVFSAGTIDFSDSSLKSSILEDKTKGVYKKLFFKDDTLAGAILLGDTKNAGKIILAMKNNSSYANAEKLLV
ncbi:FAD-dependent oxidoreductase [Clostridium oryzae]|uniref:Flavo-diiron protein FprA2 n=1 Tax=Clostridium oryzae TaxID=1450648 RepID=A0A1V4IYE4_9CLOT|nr:FAD-dependent oxidoreductase [Clostridium oryzae]OPJ65092.1 flavo-diiron protein FprA2 [Clostridium oryzae]